MDNKYNFSEQLDAELKNTIEYFKELKSSDSFHSLSNKSQKRIELLIKAYEGDSDALIEASKHLTYDN